MSPRKPVDLSGKLWTNVAPAGVNLWAAYDAHMIDLEPVYNHAADLAQAQREEYEIRTARKAEKEARNADQA